MSKKISKKQIQKILLKGLNRFFYENQYDDKYPTFRSVDLIKTISRGRVTETYLFYD